MYRILFSQWKEILPFMTIWINLEDMMLSKNKSRERQIPYELIYIWNLKEEEKKKDANTSPPPVS